MLEEAEQEEAVAVEMSVNEKSVELSGIKTKKKWKRRRRRRKKKTTDGDEGEEEEKVRPDSWDDPA